MKLQVGYLLVVHGPGGQEDEVRVSARVSRDIDAVAAYLGVSAEVAAAQLVRDGLALLRRPN